MIASNRHLTRTGGVSHCEMMNLLLTLTLASGCFRASAAAKEPAYCAFEVKVVTPSGVPAPRVPVLLIRHHTTTYAETTTSSNGLARLCDAPLESVDIAVGFDICGSVVVRNLSPSWPETHHVYVTYAPSPCDHFATSGRCRILMRVQDVAGQPVGRAQFRGLSSGVSVHGTSDQFGRMFFSFARDETVKGLITNDGDLPENVSVQCRDDVEVRVTMRKQ